MQRKQEEQQVQVGGGATSGTAERSGTGPASEDTGGAGAGLSLPVPPVPTVRFPSPPLFSSIASAAALIAALLVAGVVGIAGGSSIEGIASLFLPSCLLAYRILRIIKEIREPPPSDKRAIPFASLTNALRAALGDFWQNIMPIATSAIRVRIPLIIHNGFIQSTFAKEIVRVGDAIFNTFL